MLNLKISHITFLTHRQRQVCEKYLSQHKKNPDKLMLENARGQQFSFHPKRKNGKRPTKLFYQVIHVQLLK